MKFRKFKGISLVVFFVFAMTKAYSQHQELRHFVAAESDVAVFSSFEPEIHQSTPSPEVNVLGNGKHIANNAEMFSLYNHTDFGKVKVGGQVQKTFVIQNLGNVDLNIGDPAVTLADSGSSFRVVQPEAMTILPGKTAVFTVMFTSLHAGEYVETVKIYNDDEDEGVYTFKVKVVVEQ